MFIFFFLATVLSFITSLVATFYVRKLALRYGLVDDPKRRAHPAHTHTGIIPRAGGLAIFIGIFLPVLFLFPFNKLFLGLLLSAGLIVLIGLWDDKKDRSPQVRFVLNFVAASIAVGSGIGISYITNPFGGIVHLDSIRLIFSFFGEHSIVLLADVFALIWIVWCMNMTNWSKGVDGQMPGFVAISSLFLGILAFKFSRNDPSQINVSLLAFITAGSFLGFLVWNYYPQKIMPGYGGGALAGFMLAIISIFSYGKLGTLLLVLAVPITDAIYTLVRRLLAGKSPFYADNEHLHHKLLALGWGRRRIAAFYWFLSLVMGFISLSLSSQQKIFAVILVMALVGGFIYWLTKVTRIQKIDEDAEV